MAYRKTNVVSRKQTGTGLPHSGTETGRGEGGGGGRRGRGEFLAQTPNIPCLTFLVLLLWQSELIDLNTTNNILTGVLHDTSPADDSV